MKWLIALLSAIVFAACASTPVSRSHCPADGESSADCPWAGLARDFSRLDQGQIDSELRERVPDLFTKMHDDSRLDWTPLWGQSVNFDENAHGTIVEPKIVSVLASWAGVTVPSADGKIQHAGIEHTYGYLFSNLKTPYGFKRARWVEPTLDHGFGLPDGTIAPLPKEGSLFSNVTYLTGRIAFRNDPDRLEVLRAGEKNVASALRHYRFEDLKITRLEEKIREPRPIVIRTDFVPFPHPTGDSNSYLLIYSIVDGGPAKLVTAFPVKKSFFEMATNPENLGTDRDVIVRYNGYLSGVNGKKWKGSKLLK